MIKKARLASLVASTLLVSTAHADINFNGFASIIAGQSSDSSSIDFGYEEDLTFKNESRFALQANADLGDGLTATAQLMAKGENDFDVEFQWAYLSYALTDELTVSAGRLGTPYYRYSDFMHVGYAYRWIRTPQSVYGPTGETFEGVSAVYRSAIGDWDSAVQVIYGNSDSTNVELQDLMGANWELTKDWLTARVGYFVTDITSESSSTYLATVVDSLESQGLSDIADELLIEEDNTTFLEFGLGIDWNNFLLDAEYTVYTIDDSRLPEQTQYYVSAGYRLDQLTFSLTYEKYDTEIRDQGDLTATPADLYLDPSDENSGSLRAAVAYLYNSNLYEVDTYSATIRYDFHPAAALKADYTTRSVANYDMDVDIFSVGIDLVF